MKCKLTFGSPKNLIEFCRLFSSSSLNEISLYLRHRDDVDDITYVLLYQLLTDCFTVNLLPSSLLALCVVPDFASLCSCRCSDVCVLCCVRIPQPLYNWMKSIIQSEAFVQLLVSSSHMPWLKAIEHTAKQNTYKRIIFFVLFWHLIRLHLLSNRRKRNAQYKAIHTTCKENIRDGHCHVCVRVFSKRGNSIVVRLFQWLAWNVYESVRIWVPHCVYSYACTCACVWLLMCASVEWTEC